MTYMYVLAIAILLYIFYHNRNNQTNNFVLTPSGGNDLTMIQTAMTTHDALELKGDFQVTGTLTPRTNNTIKINGSIKQNKPDADLFNFSNQHDVLIEGGELIGMGKENGTTGWGIRTQGSNKQAYNITFKDLTCHDFRQSGIALNQLSRGGLVENCICNNNGQNGIGFGDVIGVTAKNNKCSGNRDSGINFEDAWDFKALDNNCTANGRHNLQVEHGVDGQITGGNYSEGLGDGIQIRNRADTLERSKNITISGVTTVNNPGGNINIIESDNIIVI